MQEYHNRIRELREEKHITQVRLSTELGVAQETISAYEQGRHLPSVSSLMKLSSILDASMDYIMMKSDVRNMIQVQSLSDNETRLLGYYKKLNASGKEKALSYIEGQAANNFIKHIKPPDAILSEGLLFLFQYLIFQDILCILLFLIYH